VTLAVGALFVTAVDETEPALVMLDVDDLPTTAVAETDAVLETVAVTS
jgi:hypothetical protein